MARDGRYYPKHNYDHDHDIIDSNFRYMAHDIANLDGKVEAYQSLTDRNLDVFMEANNVNHKRIQALEKRQRSMAKSNLLEAVIIGGLLYFAIKHERAIDEHNRRLNALEEMARITEEERIKHVNEEF